MAVERKLLAGVSKGVPFTEGANSIVLANTDALAEAVSASWVFTNPGWASGSLLTVFLSQDAGTVDFTAPGGWTELKGQPGGVINKFVIMAFFRVTGGSEPGSYTFTSVRSDWRQGCLLEWTGINVSNPIHVIGDWYTLDAGIPNTSNPIPAVTNLITNCMGVMHGCWDGEQSSATMWNTSTPPGWNFIQNDHPTNTTAVGQIVLNKPLPDPGDTGIDDIVNLTGSFRERQERAIFRFSIEPITPGEVKVFNVDELSQAQSLDTVASITQVEDIDASELIQVQITGNIFISEGASPDDDIFNTAEILQVQLLDSALITQNHVISIDELSQAQSLEGVILGTIFNIDELAQAQTLDGVILGIIFDTDDLSQAQPLDTATVIRNVIYNLDELSQTHDIEATELVITIRRFTSAKSNTEVQQLTIDVPSGTIDFDYLIAILATDGAGETHTAPGAWTVVENSLNSGGHTLSVWERLVSGAEPADYTFTWTLIEKAIGVILLIRGSDDVSPLASKVSVTGRSKTPFGDGLTPAQINSLLLAINSHDQTGSNFYSITYPTGLVNELNIGAGPQSGAAIQVGSEIRPNINPISQQNWLMSKKDNWYTLNLIISPLLTPIIFLDLNQSQVLDSVVITKLVTFNLDELSQNQTLDSTDIITGTFNIDELSQNQILDSTNIPFNPDELSQNQILDSVVITKLVTFSVNELDQSQTLDSTDITIMFSVNELSQSQTLDSTDITIADKVLLEDGSGGILLEDGSGVVLLE